MSTVLKTNERVVYDPKTETYAFKPIHDIRNSQQLLGYLQRMTTAQGLSVKELKDGWSGAIDTIDDLEASKDILVTRTKKDGQARMVWINDKTLNVDVDPGEFRFLDFPSSIVRTAFSAYNWPSTGRQQCKGRRPGG